jgi:hypothetical protein
MFSSYKILKQGVKNVVWVLKPTKQSIAVIFIAYEYGGWQEGLLKGFPNMKFKTLHLT